MMIWLSVYALVVLIFTGYWMSHTFYSSQWNKADKLTGLIIWVLIYVVMLLGWWIVALYLLAKEAYLEGKIRGK